MKKLIFYSTSYLAEKQVLFARIYFFIEKASMSLSILAFYFRTVYLLDSLYIFGGFNDCPMFPLFV